MSLWALITAPAHREEEAVATLTSLAHPPERTVLVTSDACACGCGPIGGHTDRPWRWALHGGDQVNIARWWRIGLTHARLNGATQVAVLSSGVTGRPSSLPTLATRAADLGLVMAGPNRHRDVDLVMGEGHCRSVSERVDGGCFLVDVTVGLVPDERFRWWYADDDLEAQARAVGPVGIVAGTALVIPPDAAPSAEARVWATEDRARFVGKWGCEPW